jgi:hypothetical protein
MASEEPRITPEEAEAFFFMAVKSGYAFGAETKRIIPLPGWKMVEHVEGDLRMVDMWHKTPGSDHSTGVAMIYWKDIPVWVMHFGGWYKPEAMPVLKEALRWCYERRKFIGGRGPENYYGSDMVYENRPVANSFTDFNGVEIIKDYGDKILGSHWYHGSWLL